MIIKQIHLENIRSYAKESILFPEGTILLSGDVGAGKSTLLLAVDFALFGLQKGNLTGESLLRNGASKGSITVEFLIDGKFVSIKRGLHRGSSIAQESVVLSVDGDAQRLTPIEMKQRVLELLHYPEELLTKSKSLIYRYTVYTPQEEMKSILLSDSDIRVDTLRKIFGIDKYKRIIQNSKIFISSLKENKKRYEGILTDFEPKRKHAETILETLNKLDADYLTLLPEKESLSLQETELQTLVEQHQRELAQHLASVQDAQALSIQLQQKLSLLQSLDMQLESMGKLLVKPEEVVPFDQIAMQTIAQTLQQKQERLKKEELMYAQVSATVAHSQRIIHQITALDVCPSCKQPVTQEHKTHIVTVEETHIMQHETEKNKLADLLTTLQNDVSLHQKQLDEYKTQQHTQELAAIRMQQYNERKIQYATLSEQRKLIHADILDLQSKKAQYEIISSGFNELQLRNTSSKQHLATVQQRLRAIDGDLIRIQTQKEDLLRQHAQLEEELEEKTKIRQKLSHAQTIHEWIENTFIPSLEKIEQQVLLKIHADFNAYYTHWFSLLMGNEDLSTSLDESFTPSVEQNGHAISYENLSGGEQTAVALAYRLALNHVINTLMVELKTEGLLILDEPTDGFSHEQVDRIKLILDELKLKQIIIVSHEPKMEGFVDHIIKIEKADHTSKAVLSV